ncbi:MAG: response regulator [Burkholderiaceae bacterium]|nr:response regulator [Burkholderiaceae bacterium]
MALIVVMEDDGGTRMLITSVLKRDGHEVLATEDGRSGLELVRQHRPDLVISDIRMPGMDGLQMLASLRRDASLVAIPVILLTSLQERAHMRIGMTAGADDYITKPFRSAELRDAVGAQLRKRELHSQLQHQVIDTAVRSAIDTQTQRLAQLYEQRLAKELASRWPVGEGQEDDQRFADATVLFVDIPGYAALSERLSSAELAGLVKRFYGSAGDTVYLFGAAHMQFIGEGLLAVFGEGSDTQSVRHGLRAARAALGLADSARGIRQHLDQLYPERKLPRFDISAALHHGPVTLTRLQDPLHDAHAQILPVGDAVTTTMLLREQIHKQGWIVGASAVVAHAVAPAAQVGRRARMQLPGRSVPVDAVELLSLAVA